MAVQFLMLFANPLVLILLIASGVSACTGDIGSASIIIVIVFLGTSVNFVQTYRSQRAVERLREGVATTATVLRDDGWREVPPRELVPGDVIRLTAGDLVPADACLLQTKDLYVQQAALTGESMPAEKEAMESVEPPRQLADARNAVFLGTSVISGTATAVIEKTGRATAFGDIAARLAARPPETEFERGARRFSFFIMRTVLFLVLFVFLVNVVLRHDALQSLLFAVALAVGLTPEFLPMIVSVTLAQGAVHMAQEGHRQTLARDTKFRQHGYPVQRQDRHTYQRRDGVAPTTRSAGPTNRTGMSAGLPEQLLRNGHQEPP